VWHLQLHSGHQLAREQLEVLVGDARRAALNAGFVRLRLL